MLTTLRGWRNRREPNSERDNEKSLVTDKHSVTIVGADLRFFSEEQGDSIFLAYKAHRLTALEYNINRIHFKKMSEPDSHKTIYRDKPEMVEMEGVESIGLNINFRYRSTRDRVYLNRDHPFVEWRDRMVELCRTPNDFNLDQESTSTLDSLLVNAIRYDHNVKDFQNFLDRWRKMEKLPMNLRPPIVKEEELPMLSLRDHLLEV